MNIVFNVFCSSGVNATQSTFAQIKASASQSVVEVTTFHSVIPRTPIPFHQSARKDNSVQMKGATVNPILLSVVLASSIAMVRL